LVMFESSTAIMGRAKEVPHLLSVRRCTLYFSLLQSFYAKVLAVDDSSFRNTKLPFWLANESHQQLKPFRESKVCFDATKMVENVGTVHKDCARLTDEMGL
jgi:hypothetical protein